MDASYGKKRKEKHHFFQFGGQNPNFVQNSEMGGPPNCPIEFLSISKLREEYKKSRKKSTVSLHKWHSQKTSWVRESRSTELQTSQSK